MSPSHHLYVLDDRTYQGKINMLVHVVRQKYGKSSILVDHFYPEPKITFKASSFCSGKDHSFVEAGAFSYTRRGIQRHLSPDIFRPLEDRYSNFNGRELLVKANNNAPFHGLKKLESGAFIPDSGIDVSVVNALSETLNFTWRVETPRDGKWGGPLPDGTVSGMIGEIARREGHFAICEITITGLRETVVDFSSPYYFESLIIVTLAPPEKNRAFAIFSPFTMQVWLCIAVSTLLIGPVLRLETIVMKSYMEERNGDEKFDYSTNNFSFNAFRSLVVQSNLLQAKYWPHRFIFIFWYLFCFYISALYSGTLTAVLVTPTFEKPIDYLTDIPEAVKSQGYSLGVIGDSAFEELFKSAKEGIYEEIWTLFNHKERSKSFFSYPDQGFDQLVKGKFIFVNSQMGSKIRAIRKGLNKFHFSRQTFYPQGYGIACNSGSPFRMKFNDM
ncbi:hypothetical protein SK128_018158 [Halocaridina rubra]|uniref:Ionotropic glutamate receptor L-glutamate and glycine-binding domain-containing protein n=1 Tax=Halocaridina rubra TaxID=373956 RepID=A0AAN9AEI7_HALRR